MTRSDFKLSPKAVAVINAVEGLYLTPDAEARLNDLRSKNITQSKRRELVLKAFKSNSI